ncbi:D-lactaldehyde dehydrogenase [Infundibulicybe gibba]|nr:D-lactaldehyde dehydrogenase [Infundibulicybe gibba]
MPTIPSGSTVLVTGANSFIGMWVVRELLEKGYGVRGAVRRASKARYVQEVFATYGDKLEMIVVEDITKEGAFDEAIRGVSAVEHLASPVTVGVDDPQLIIKPAVEGTIGILQSALKSRSELLKRIVITSSVAAIQAFNYTSEPVIRSETYWNNEVLALVEEKGRDAPGESKYGASKTLAEQAAWSFVNKHKHEISWDLVCTHPPFVFGPCLHEMATPADLGLTAGEWYMKMILGNFTSKDPPIPKDRPWIDVRDVATAHVLALEKPEAGGERIILCAGPSVWQEWLDAANALFPPGTSRWKFPRGEPGRKITHMMEYDTSKAARILGMRYRTMEEIITDTLADYQRRGW